MKKKNRPVQQAANSDIRTSDITPTTSPVQVPKRTPKKHRARVYMLRTGIEGWTENDILRYCRLSSGRNYATELERQLGITLERIDEKNPDGTVGLMMAVPQSCFGILKGWISQVLTLNERHRPMPYVKKSCWGCLALNCFFMAS
ncbi:hypothetical protein [Escherichia coli]|uniref:hypothetical protein n=1 Tax=Escherichia coli TaxID=562 RepID=UPI001D5026E9|nr:hypothetical protein [Escherichia coli]CAE6311469.1 hypothetical protein AI2715V1_0077 [Escherichia coli]CAH3320955.1 hypothetical protein AI2715V1_0077 [Escherichia coli]